MGGKREGRVVGGGNLRVFRDCKKKALLIAFCCISCCKAKTVGKRQWVHLAVKLRRGRREGGEVFDRIFEG